MPDSDLPQGRNSHFVPLWLPVGLPRLTYQVLQ
jgi:hypothetical protein